MSTLNIHHQGITLEWIIEEPAVAEKVMITLWAMIADSGAIPAGPQRERSRPTRRRTITPEFLAEVAEVYRAAPDNAKRRAVREAFGVSDGVAGNYINQARHRGILEPSTTHGLGGRKPRPDAQSGIWAATLTDVMENSSDQFGESSSPALRARLM